MLLPCFPSNGSRPVRSIVSVLIAWLCPISRPIDLSLVLDYFDLSESLLAVSSFVISHSRRCPTKRVGARRKIVPANSGDALLFPTPLRTHTADTSWPILAVLRVGRLRRVRSSSLELESVSVIARRKLHCSRCGECCSIRRRTLIA